MRLAHHEPEEPEPGHEAWSPRMGRLGKACVWLILAMMALGTFVQLWIVAFG